MRPERVASQAWKTTPKQSGVPIVEHPGAPLRPYRVAGEEQQSVSPTEGNRPLAASTPRRHPIHDLRTDGGEWTEMVDGDDGELIAQRTTSPPPDSAPSTSTAKHQIDDGRVTELADDGSKRTVVQPSTADVAQAERCVAPDIPVKQRPRYKRLLKYLGSFERQKRRPPISPSRFGELQTDKPVRGTSYVDVLRALFVNSGFQTAGLCEAVGALRNAGAPADFLGSRRALDLYMVGHTLSQGGAGRVKAKHPPGRAPRVLLTYK